MRDTKIILIEGLFGQGKSTLAEELGQALSSPEFSWKVITEWDKDHPMKIAPDQIVGQVQSPNLEITALRQWELFVKKAQSSDHGFIIDSQAWQHAALFQLIADKSEKTILNLNHLLNGLLQPLQPSVIYLTSSIPGGRASDKEPRSAWFSWVVDQCEELPWLCNRQLTGMEGFDNLSKAWQELSGQLYKSCPFPKLKLEDTHLDRAEAQKRIIKWLDVSPAPAG